MRTLDRSPVPIVAEHDTPIAMRDGTILRADVFRPQGTVPTLLVRGPYGGGAFRSVPVMPAIEAGFAVVLQHCRGRGTSDGDFQPWLDEGPDGYDTIEWIAGQDWSNGDVVMSGVSYLAGCALQAAAMRPSGLRAVVATMTPYDFYDGLNYYGGAFALGSALYWGTLQTMLGLMHSAAAGEDVGAGFGALLPLLADQPAAQRTLPLRDVPLANFREWIAHPTRDEYWEGAARTLRHDQIQVPVMHTGGWFDLFLAGTLENHRRLGGPLTIGPWTHAQLTTNAGRLDFGFFAAATAARLEERELAFLAAASDYGEPSVRIFVMGDNVWRDEPAWPLAAAVPTRYYLHIDGRLDPAEPTSAEPRTFTHDPADPVPTVGGPLLLADPTLIGPQEQRDVEARPDVLCYTTDVLTADVEVTGPLSVTLIASTSAVSTDWTAKLVDVWPDDRAMSVIDGIVRVAAEPGEPANHVVDLVATSQVFKAGHRIRVQIASSNFPRFDRNPGTGKTSAESAGLVVAQQRVYPQSFITLPIVAR
jgi:putative CocE/NonD family hydrolase